MLNLELAATLCVHTTLVHIYAGPCADRRNCGLVTAVQDNVIAVHAHHGTQHTLTQDLYVCSSCTDRVKTALKTIAASNPAGDEASSRRRGTLTANSTARSGKPAAMGAGVWSWWSDEPLYGDTSSINARLTQGRTVEECLYACNDDEVCAGVVVRYSSSSNMFESCSYLQGRVTTTPGDPSTALRSMIKYRTAGTDKPDGL